MPGGLGARAPLGAVRWRGARAGPGAAGARRRSGPGVWRGHPSGPPSRPRPRAAGAHGPGDSGARGGRVVTREGRDTEEVYFVAKVGFTKS